MHDNWPYVAAAYAAMVLTFGVWFWMIVAKLRRLARARTAQQQQPTTETPSNG